MSLDLTKLIVRLPGENKGGICAEYEVAYLELDKLAAGIPQSIMGDSVIEGKEPDWKRLRQNCLELWNQTRDLRVATYLTVASICLDGIDGLRDGLKVIDYLIKDNWEDFWPRLDPEDGRDPTERINILSMLSPLKGSYNDPLMFISRFRDIRLFQDKPYTLRDYMIASSEIDSGETAINFQSFNAEMASVPMEAMRGRLDEINEIISLLNDISKEINDKTEGIGIVSFEALYDELKILAKFYSSYIPGESEISEEGNFETEDLQGNTVNPRAANARAFNLNGYRPTTRNEALMLLRKSADYFRSTEPTNPVPYLLERALRIAGMNFVDLLADISPDSLERIRDQLGINKDNQGTGGI